MRYNDIIYSGEINEDGQLHGRGSYTVPKMPGDTGEIICFHNKFLF